MGDHIVYDAEMLSTVINRPVNTIRLALTTFKKFKMVEETDAGLYITNWEKYQNIVGMDRVKQLTRQRVSKFRNRIELQKDTQLLLNAVGNSESVTLGNVTVTHTDIDNRQDIEVDKNKTRQEEDVLLPSIDEILSNVFLFYEQNIETLNDTQKRLITEACQKYSDVWVTDAILEIKDRKTIKHKWAYILSILQDWESNGHTVKSNATDSKINKFTSGKYGGHVVSTAEDIAALKALREENKKGNSDVSQET